MMTLLNFKYTLYFPFTQSGYDAAFKTGIEFSDTSYAEAIKHAVASKQIDTVVRNKIKDKMQFSDSDFLEWRKQVCEYAKKIGLAKESIIIKEIEKGEYNKNLYARYKTKWHYMDVALELVQMQAEQMKINEDRKEFWNTEAPVLEKTHKKHLQMMFISQYLKRNTEQSLRTMIKNTFADKLVKPKHADLYNAKFYYPCKTTFKLRRYNTGDTTNTLENFMAHCKDPKELVFFVMINSNMIGMEGWKEEIWSYFKDLRTVIIPVIILGQDAVKDDAVNEFFDKFIAECEEHGVETFKLHEAIKITDTEEGYQSLGSQLCDDYKALIEQKLIEPEWY